MAQCLLNQPYGAHRKQCTSKIFLLPVLADSPSLTRLKPFKAATLSSQLVRKHAVNNTIIIAFANANHIDYAFNWLTYVFANNITNYLVGAVDRTTARTLAGAGVNFFSMYDDVSKGTSEMPEGTVSCLTALPDGVLCLSLVDACVCMKKLGQTCRVQVEPPPACQYLI